MDIQVIITLPKLLIVLPVTNTERLFVQMRLITLLWDLDIGHILSKNYL